MIVKQITMEPAFEELFYECDYCVHRRAKKDPNGYIVILYKYGGGVLKQLNFDVGVKIHIYFMEKGHNVDCLKLDTLKGN